MKISLSLKQLFVLVAVFLIAAQFVPSEITNPPSAGPMAAPRPVAEILQRACFDCHSHETSWPWYASVAPVSWLVARDVNRAREKVNFSTWNRLGLREQEQKQKEIWEAVKGGHMPPPFYVLVHPGGKVTTDEHRLLRSWAGEADPGY